MAILKDIRVLIAIAAIILIACFTQTRNTGSDPRGTLLVTEQILLHGTVKLDAYNAEALQDFAHMIYRKNNHSYYYFPIGSSLASIPFIAAAQALDVDIFKSEGTLQIIIACFTTVFTFILLIKLAQLFLDRSSALLIAGVFLFGSAWISTTLTALWSHNFATLFALLSIYLFARIIRHNQAALWPWLAICLFAAYLCRPTLSLLSPMLLLALFTQRPALAIRSGLLLASLLALFITWSQYEFSQLLPDYYSPKRLETNNFQEALLGNLLSPARGLLIYSPFILVAWLCYGRSRRTLDLGKAWLLIGLGWPLLHLLFISRFPHWWGGHSYGSRLMMDVLPGLFLLTISVWPSLQQIIQRKLLATPLLLSALFAIAINSGQGLLNQYTLLWNAQPNVDEHRQYLFDWQYPQFLANPSGHHQRLRESIQGRLSWLPALSPGEILRHDSEKLVFIGWSHTEREHRWSSSPQASILFNLNATPTTIYHLALYADSLGPQRTRIFLNDKLIYTGIIGNHEIEIPASQFRTAENEISFEFPDARQPGNGDPRTLAMAFKGMQLLANTPGGIPEESPNIP